MSKFARPWCYDAGAKRDKLATARKTAPPLSPPSTYVTDTVKALALTHDLKC